MGVRLARSGLKPGPWTTVTAPCQGCGELSELQVLDESYAYCPLCGTTNRWIRLRVEDGEYFVPTRRDDPMPNS